MTQNQEDELIERLKAEVVKRAKTSITKIPPPVSSTDIDLVEKKLCFSLPLLLKRYYLEVGDGGLGPGWEGFYQLSQLPSIYSAQRAETEEAMDYYTRGLLTLSDLGGEIPKLWPEQMLPISGWSNDSHSCIDCSQLDFPVYRYNGDVHHYQLAIEAPSLIHWFEAWFAYAVPVDLDWEKVELIGF